MNKELKEMITIGKSLERDFNQIVKVLSKKIKKPSDRRSGFAMPSLLTNELYEFMDIQRGELVERNDVTRRVNQYIKENDLERPDNKRFIVPDKTLEKLLGNNDKNVEVSYFNLQHFLKHHYVKELEVSV